MPFGQLIIGPPGAGKTTYCAGMQQFLSAIGRKSSIVNLDPAAAEPRTAGSYKAAVDVRELVPLEDIMREEHLGPNGGVLYALEAALQQQDGAEWLVQRLRGLGPDEYVLFDCPGQVEAFTHHGSLRDMVWRLQRECGYRLVAVHLTDSFCLTQPSLYISTLLLSLRAMLQLELPHINVLSKIDKLAAYGATLPFNLAFYTDVQDLSYLLPHLASEGIRHPRFDALNRAVVDLVEDFGLVAYETLAVENKKSMMALLHAIDRAGGYAFGAAEGANDTVWQVAVREGGVPKAEEVDLQERWIDAKDEWDERERREEEDARAAVARREGVVPGVGDDDVGDDDGEEVDASLSLARSDVEGSGVKVVRKG